VNVKSFFVVLLEGLRIDSEVFVVATLTMTVLVILGLAVYVWSKDHFRLRETRDSQRRLTRDVTSRDLELVGLRLRLCGLEKSMEEMCEALVSAQSAAAMPIAGAAAPAGKPSAEADNLPAALVCAADARAARAYEGLLKARGFRVRRCADGGDAIALAMEDKPGLVLMELACAGEDPVRALRAVRGHMSQGGRLIAIAADARQAAAAADAGAEAFTLPLDFVELARSLRAAAPSARTKR